MSTTDGFAQLKDANIRWGALGISAASVFVSPSITKPSRLRVSGGFQAERGGDKLVGQSISFDVDKQVLDGEAVSIRHDVFRIDTASFTRGPLGMSLSDVVIVDNVPEQKRSYILFLLNGKKHPLQRLLYQNFIGDLKPYDCVKYKCKRTFVCYNIHHLEKKARKLNTDRKAWIPYCITIEFSSSSKFIVEF
jgi:hypothetical protein